MSKQLIPIENWHEHANNEHAYLYEPIRGIYEKYHVKLAQLQHNKYEGYESFICIVMSNGMDAPPQLTQAAVDALQKPPVPMATHAEVMAINVGLQQALQANKKEVEGIHANLQQALQAHKKKLTEMTLYLSLFVVGIVAVSAYSGYQHVQLKQLERKMADNNAIKKIQGDLKTANDQLIAFQKTLNDQKGSFVSLTDFESVKQQVNQHQPFVDSIKAFLTIVQPNLVMKPDLNKRDAPFVKRLDQAENDIHFVNSKIEKHLKLHPEVIR